MWSGVVFDLAGPHATAKVHHPFGGRGGDLAADDAGTIVCQTRLIGVLMASRQNDAISEARLTEFRNGLAKLGWTEDRNIRFEIRYAGGDRDMARSPSLGDFTAAI